MAHDLSAREAPLRYGDICISCSDPTVEVRVLELLGDQLALVDTGEAVSVALVPAEVGDRILVHASEAVALLDR